MPALLAESVSAGGRVDRGVERARRMVGQFSEHRQLVESCTFDDRVCGDRRVVQCAHGSLRNHVIATIPHQIPLLHGDVTLNALVFGLLERAGRGHPCAGWRDGGRSLDWAALVRMLPPGLTTIAVAGSVAFAFLPQTAKAFVDIKEAQAARGHRLRSARDLVPLLAPLLTGGLERALTLAESSNRAG